MWARSSFLRRRKEAVEGERARDVVHDREHVRAEVLLQLRVLVQVVQHDLGDGVALQDDDQALAGTARGLVADVGDSTDTAVLHQLGDLDRQVVRVDLVRQFGDDQADTALDLLDADDGAHRDRAAAGAVGVLDALDAEDLRAGREVRPLDPLDQLLEELLARSLRVGEVPESAVGDLTEVVRRDVRRHADRDADRAVDQQVREPARENGRLLGATVVVVLEVDGLLVDVPDHLERERGHLRLGVPRRRGAVVAG